SRRALRLRRRRRRDRLRRFRDHAVLWRLPPGTGLRRRHAVHLPVRRAGHAVAPVAGARRAGVRRPRRRTVGGARRPLQRAARPPWGGIAPRRDVPGGRLMARKAATRTVTHLDAAGRPAMVDVSGKPDTAREALAECRVRFPREVAAQLRASGLRSAKGGIVDTAIVAGTMAVKRTHELI